MNIQTLMSYSVEDFISEEERITILNHINELLKREGREKFLAGNNGKSVHSIDGYDTKEVVDFYEPFGRLEITELPLVITDILDESYRRNLDKIKRAFPDSDVPDCWIYLEYDKGQYITPHADYPNNELRPNNIKLTGINILLENDADGGEFYIETCGSDNIWKNGLLVDNVNYSNNFFKEKVKRTKWTVNQEERTAIFYGTNLIHGTNEIKNGIVKKIVGFITAK